MSSVQQHSAFMFSPNMAVAATTRHFDQVFRRFAEESSGKRSIGLYARWQLFENTKTENAILIRSDHTCGSIVVRKEVGTRRRVEEDDVKSDTPISARLPSNLNQIFDERTIPASDASF